MIMLLKVSSKFLKAFLLQLHAACFITLFKFPFT